jgi:hypothetical protein
MPHADATDVIPRVLVEIVENALFFGAAAQDDVAIDVLSGASVAGRPASARAARSGVP